MEKCIYCGSTNIEKGLSVGSGNFKTGLKYVKLLMPQVEWFYADLCKDCGSVRIYVKETDRNWD
jgi:predicted nucleic-acid-binding Zn-ribbon protein